MDTNKDASTSEVPTFKVARVGQARKRKGGAFSFLRGGGAGPRGAWSGATGGSGAASVGGYSATALNGFGLTFSKTMLVIIATSVIGSGAIYGGIQSAANSRPAAPAKPALFSQEKIKLEGDTSNLPSTPNTIPNSMGFVTGSRDGLTPEERAQREADAAAAAEAQRVADEEAAKKAEAEQTAANAAPDPNELLASAKEDGKEAPGGTAFGKKFGSLSTNMGGGSALTGGAGLSGGVNRQFAPKTAPAIPKAAAGSMTAMKGGSRPTYARSGNSKLAASKTKGFARKQLAHANAYSRRGASSGKGENAASDAGTAFDNNSSAGHIISGAGIGAGKGGNGGADATMNPNGSEGGPTGGDPTMDCGANNYQTADGGCAPIKETGGKDANPTLTLISNVVMAMLGMIGVIAAIAAMSGPFGPWMIPVLIAMGAIIGLLGLAMMAMGDIVAGGIATAAGAAIAYMAAFALPSLTVGKGLIMGFGGPAMMMVSKMLTGGGSGKDKAPVAAQQ